MGNILTLTREETTQLVMTPVVQNSKLYGAIGVAPNGAPTGLSPVGVSFQVGNGEKLRKVTVPNGFLQVAPTETQRRQSSYLPKSWLSHSSVTWALQEYGLGFVLTQKDIENIAGQIGVAKGADGAAQQIEGAIYGLIADGLRRDITTYAFWGQSGVNFTTAYPDNSWDLTDTPTNLALKDGFMATIQDLVTAETIFNFDTALLDGDPLSNEDVETLLTEVVNGAGASLSQLMDADIDIQQKPVFIVSASVYNAYKRLLGAQGSATAFYFQGFDAEGRLLPNVLALQYNNCLMIAGSEVFELWASVSAGTKNKHYAILTSRDNLRVAFNYAEGGDGLAMETKGFDAGGWSVIYSLFPRMDFKIAEQTDNGLSVAGFTAPE